jgi:NTE family protein
MLVPPYRISLSGGSLKGLAHIGALEALHARGLLKGVREYIGISAGALIAFMMCIGCTLTEIRASAVRVNLGVVRDLSPETLFSFPDTYGLDSGENLKRLVVAILRAKGLSPDITFGELAAMRRGPRLRLFVTNLNKCCPEELNETVRPTFPICLAVLASMSIPVYFRPVEDPVSGHLYVDGGMVTHNPFRLLSHDERETTLAIAFGDAHKPTETISSLPQFLIQMYHSVEYHYIREIEEHWRDRILPLQIGNFNALNFEVGENDKQILIDKGRAEAERWLAAPPVKRPARRFSVG